VKSFILQGRQPDKGGDLKRDEKKRIDAIQAEENRSSVGTKTNSKGAKEENDSYQNLPVRGVRPTGKKKEKNCRALGEGNSQNVE